MDSYSKYSSLPLDPSFNRIELELKSVYAKLDNLDRSVQELNLTIQQSELARKRELDLTQRILEEDRSFSKGIVLQDREIDQKKSKRDEDLEDSNRKILLTAMSSVWEKGGQWIVAALCLLIVLRLQSCAGGFDLTQIVGAK